MEIIEEEKLQQETFALQKPTNETIKSPESSKNQYTFQNELQAY